MLENPCQSLIGWDEQTVPFFQTLLAGIKFTFPFVAPTIDQLITMV